MKNWKTTLAGIVVACVAFATSMGWINFETATAISALAVALGFVVAKDNDVTEE